MKINKKNILGLITIIAIIVLTVCTTSKPLAAATTIYSNKSTPIDGTYGFNFRWINGITTATPINIPAGATCPDENVYCISLDAPYNKGTAAVRYNNIGEYKGKVVDLKVTLMDWTPYNPALDNQAFSFSNVTIGFDITRIENVTLKFDFLKHNTNTPINVDGYITMADLDYNQYFEFGNKSALINHYLYEGNTFITADNGRFNSQFDEADSQPHGRLDGLVMTTFSGSTLTLLFGQTDEVAPSYAAFFGFAADSIGRFTLPKPLKEVDKDEVVNSEEFEYKVSQLVPYSNSEDYYKTFIFTDTLDENLVVPEVQDIIIRDDNGQTVTSKFNVSIDGHTIKAEALNSELSKADFYSKTYTVSFITSVNPNASNSLFLEKGYYKINNKANFSRTTNTHPEKENSETDVTVTNAKRTAKINYKIIGDKTMPEDLTDKVPEETIRYIGETYETEGELTTRYTEENCKFKGWYYDTSLKNKAEETFKVEGDTTLYGMWQCPLIVSVPPTAANAPFIILGIGLIAIGAGTYYYLYVYKNKKSKKSE